MLPQHFFSECVSIATGAPEFRRSDRLRYPLVFVGVAHGRRSGQLGTGYADGRFGRRHRCPACLDQRSYSSGYDVGRAVNMGLCRNVPRLRYARWPIYLRFQIHSSGDDVPA
jgi:hypothetical protein